jgi:hypothetical protein
LQPRIFANRSKLAALPFSPISAMMVLGLGARLARREIDL